MIRTMHLLLAVALVVAGGCGGSSGAEPSTDPAAAVGSPTAEDILGSGLATAVAQQEPVPLGTSGNVGRGWHLTVDAVDSDAASTA
jgi:hypothetical protein